MAYTYIGQNRVEWGEGPGSPENAYFHLKDVTVVMNQPGATAFNVMKAKVNGKDCNVIVAVKEKNDTGAIEYLQDPNHIIALPCPPLTDQLGGVFLATP